MDAYAVHGLETEQVSYLDALDHLNRTSEYGVTFERGTMVQYGDRRHIFISGTASINKYGEIVHPGDLSGQLDCLFGNIRALLAEADAGMHNVMQMIVYVRDPGDYAAVGTWIDAYFPQIPRSSASPSLPTATTVSPYFENASGYSDSIRITS